MDEKHIAVLRIDFELIHRLQKDPGNAIINLLEGIPQGAVLYKAIWNPGEMLGLVFSHESFEEVCDGKMLQELELKPTGEFPWESKIEEQACNHCFCNVSNPRFYPGKIIHLSICCKCGANAEVYVKESRI